MVIVKFVGGIKKLFNIEFIELDVDDITLEKLLELVLEKKPENTPSMDMNNILIAINGADSSALEGKYTRIKKNDEISLIPIIHGGSNKRMVYKTGKKTIQIFEIKGGVSTDVTFLDNIRREFPEITLQAVSSKFILNPYHFKKIISISVQSQHEKILLSNKLETDILMRFAITSQINTAIKLVGIKPRNNFILISIGKKTDLDKLFKKLSSLTIDLFSKKHNRFLKKHFQITKNQIDSIYSKNPIEDILIEKASILL